MPQLEKLVTDLQAQVDRQDRDIQEIPHRIARDLADLKRSFERRLETAMESINQLEALPDQISAQHKTIRDEQTALKTELANGQATLRRELRDSQEAASKEIRDDVAIVKFMLEGQSHTVAPSRPPKTKPIGMTAKLKEYREWLQLIGWILVVGGMLLSTLSHNASAEKIAAAAQKFQTAGRSIVSEPELPPEH